MNLNKEVWVGIKGYENMYQISNLGRVKSLERWVNHGLSEKQFVENKILKPRLYNNGYFFIVLCRDGKKKNSSIHRLVASAFIENIGNKEWVNHKNGIKIDNDVNNLEWVTSSENRIHAFTTGLQKPHSLKPIIANKKNGEFVGKFESIHDASRKLNLLPSHICSVCSGKRKSTGKMIFNYL